MISFEIDLSSPFRHCQIALGSLSRGSSSTPCFRAIVVSSGPATMIDSLLANAMFFPASMAASVGSRATSPTVAVTTSSTSGSRTISSIEQSLLPFDSNAAFSPSAHSQETSFGVELLDLGLQELHAPGVPPVQRRESRWETT